jgi:hypothetical protein
MIILFSPEIRHSGPRNLRCCAAFSAVRFRLLAIQGVALDAKAGTGTQLNLAVPDVRSTKAIRAGAGIWTVASSWVTSLIGNEDMTCPARELFAASDPGFRGTAAAARPAEALVSEGTVYSSVSHCCRSRKGRSAIPAVQRAACPRELCSCMAYCPCAFPFHPPTYLPRDAALHRQGLAATFASRTLPGGSGLGAVTPERVSHGQQNVNRCIPPRRNAGGRPSR